MGKKVKILVVEDEPIIAADIEMILESLDYEVTGLEDNAEDALLSIEKNLPDLILLDINIEGDTDGVMLAQDIKEKYNVPFVFLTSNTESFTINRVKRTQPAGFIVKPFDEKDLRSNIEIALFSNITTPQVKGEDVKYIFVKASSEYVKIALEDLMFIKAEDNYSRIFSVDKNFILSSTLKRVEEKLSNNKFIRIHRSYIINIEFIDKYKEGVIYIGKHQLPIGRSYQDAFFKRVSKF